MSEPTTEKKSSKPRLSSFQMGSHRIDVAAPTNLTPTTPVLMMHDGGNLLLPREETWNGQNWAIVDSLEAGLISGEAQPVVIGVHTGEGTSRLNELAPASITKALPNVYESFAAEARPALLQSTSDEYHAFLADEVLPKVASQLGIVLDPSRTAIGGSSMGGLASIYGLGLRPETYGTALAFSTHWPFGGQVAVQELIGALPKAGVHRLWLDSGNTELDAAYPALHYSAIDLLIQNQWRRDQHFEARIYAGTGHQEKYWAARWPDAVNWWLSPSPR